MSKEWMFSWILTVKNDDEWMQTRKATLILKDLIETMGDVFKETYSPRVPAELTYVSSVVIVDRESVRALDAAQNPRLTAKEMTATQKFSETYAKRTGTFFCSDLSITARR